MLIVKTTLKEIHRKGIGLVAAEPIKKGQVIWRYHPLIDIEIKEEDIPPKAKAFYDTYAVEQEPGRILLNTDNARFINHDEHPNTKSLGPLLPNVATKNIAVGDEITIDYNTIDIGGATFEQQD